jgi:type VI secretion system secreted protein VgrG
LLPECVRGEEGLSQAYLFKIDALSTDADIALKALHGQPALLQLQTASSSEALRPFHGHIIAIELAGADGGFARYTLTVEPWSAFLALGRDSRIFQGMSVFDIVDAVFRTYRGKGKLMPAWRFDIADQSAYPKRSLTTQYQESDLAFVERLMYEEGLFYFFEHSGDARSRALGSHTMVIADHNGAFKPNAQAAVQFTQPGAVMTVDSMDRWRTQMRASANSIEMSSWDYRIVRQRQAGDAAGGNDPPLASRDTPGAYAYQSGEQGRRIARNQQQASEATRQVHVGAGTVRTLAPGTTFTLHGHAGFDQAYDDETRTFLVVRAVHLMHNNLRAELTDGIGKLLGKSAVAKAIADERAPHAVGKTIGERPLYRNRVDVILRSTPYRRSGTDGQGRLLHPRPHVRGQQTAIVVGPPGAMIHTDRDHRIKVQFHWQRGAASHSRLDHPAPESHTGAPGDDTAGTWIRVATPVAGANWGTNMIPRVGQEVLIDFLDGNIDRPVAICSLYNGRGKVDAQYNQVCQGPGAATGNAPAWFPGESGGHAHAATLSGIKTQAMQDSQSGVGAYSQLVFDDSPGQARVALQRHAKAHDGSAELNLGHLLHQVDNERLHAVGFGAELKTEHSVALRTGGAMLLSSDARSGGDGGQMDSREAQSQIEASHQLQLEMVTLAQKHNALIKGEPEPLKLAAPAQMAHSADVLKHAEEGRADGGQHKEAAADEPHLQLSSPAGIVASTPADAIFAAGLTSSVNAGQDINLAAQRNAYSAVTGGISMFTYGKASSKDKPNQEVGLKLHAASGKVSSQSQTGATAFIADKAITVAGVTKAVTVTAPNKHVLLTAQGAVLKLEGGNIELHGPGKIEFKATMKELAGPVSVASAQSAKKLQELRIKRDLEIEYVDADGNVLTDEPIAMYFSDGSDKKVTLDGEGKATIKNAPLGPFRSKQPRRK